MVGLPLRGVRVIKQFSRLIADLVKMVFSHLAHQPLSGRTPPGMLCGG
jgi:hypothetical protein